MFWLVAIVLAAFAGAWLRGAFSPPTAEDRAREEAERIKEKVRELTH